MKQNNKYCHSELVSESIVTLTRTNKFNLNSQRGSQNGFRTKSGMTGESGRSMVEMLGVLAIIGVLSVGGISGYTTAMNKHKANEILNAAAVRAMAVSTQLQNGSTTPSLGEFTEHEVSGATFTDGPVTSSGGKFTIGFVTGSEPSEAVLKQMEQIAGTEGIVRKITDGGLIYNDDLSTEVRASDFDGDGEKNGENCIANHFKWCADSKTCLADTTANCPVTGPSCPPNSSSNKDAEGYAGGSFVVTSGSDKLTCYCRSNYKYASGACDTPMDDVCYNYEANECGRGRYCQFNPDGNCTDTPTQGTCKDIGPCGMRALGTTGMMGSDYTGDCQPDWWTAHSICASVGKHIPTLDEVGCADSKYDTCTSTVLSLIRNNGFTYGFWTEDLTEGAGSCSAFFVGLDDAVDDLDRDISRDAIVCVE